MTDLNVPLKQFKVPLFRNIPIDFAGSQYMSYLGYNVLAR